MRFFRPFLAFAFMLFLSVGAWAQNVRIIYPQEGQDVRGEVTVRFEGIPQGGYAIVKIDGNFKRATAQEFVVFNTLADRATFNKGQAPSQSDGTYRLEITVLAPGGGRVGTATVNFNVANSRVDESGESVRLSHWTAQDRINNQVQRFRVFAESNANIEGGAAAGGAGGGGGGGDAAAAGGEAGYLPAPLDFQVTALMRRVVRDVGLFDSAANISTTVQEAFERGREGGQSGAGAEATGANAGAAAAAGIKPRRKKKAGPTVPVKGPWLPLWTKSDETGKYFIKMITQSGREINATRKASNVAIADLLPTFPETPVRPGSTWETTMSILGDLSSRLPINVQAPITFTAYDTLLTPAGESRRCAKLESRFRLPDNLAKKIAVNLGNKSGSAGGAGGAGGATLGGGVGAGGVGAEAGAETGLIEEDIEVARTDVNRVLWFDMDKRQIVRSEDTIRSYFEIPPLEGEGAVGGAPAGGDAATPTEPTKISYNLSVTTWVDDRIPAPNEIYTGGLGTAHGSDSVPDVSLDRVRGRR